MFSERFKALAASINSCEYSSLKGEISEKEAYEMAHHYILQAYNAHGIVYVIGNGGSAGIASHFSNDLMKALKIPSQTLYDSNILTCLANDIGYENGFSYMLERLLKKEDLLVAISSSGKSPNILNAVTTARSVGVPVISLSGFQKDNPLREFGDLNFWIDRHDYGLVETAHFFLLHTIVDLWNKEGADISHARIKNHTYAK